MRFPLLFQILTNNNENNYIEINVNRIRSLDRLGAGIFCDICLLFSGQNLSKYQYNSAIAVPVIFWGIAGIIEAFKIKG